MKLYADTPARRTAQLLGDLFVVLWLVLWVWMGVTVHDVTLGLADPGRSLDSSATDLASNLQGAGDRLDDVPLVGDDVAGPFDDAAGASERIAQTGRDTVAAVERLAFWLGISVATIPILLALAFHLPRRWRFVRQATAGARFVDSGDDLDLFALRALAHQPLHVLARISDDPAGAWRERDPDVVRRLADLELRSAGLLASHT